MVMVMVIVVSFKFKQIILNRMYISFSQTDARNLRMATRHMCTVTVSKAVRNIMLEASKFDINQLPSDVDNLVVFKFPDTINIASIVHQVDIIISICIYTHFLIKSN